MTLGAIGFCTPSNFRKNGRLYSPLRAVKKYIWQIGALEAENLICFFLLKNKSNSLPLKKSIQSTV